MSPSPWQFGSAGRVRRVLAADLDSLPWCESCSSRSVLSGDPAWALAAENEWGFCGVSIVSDGQTIAAALVSPALYVPRGHRLASAANADAAALLWLRVADERRGGNLGKQLVQGLAARLADQRNIQAIDATCSTEGVCTAPAPAWLDKVGFHALSDGVRYRLDLAAAESWLSRQADVWRQVSQALKPQRPPRPVTPSSRTSNQA